MTETIHLTDWIFLVFGLAVYFDATHKKIGHVKGLKGFPNMSAGAWATWASFNYFGLVAIALYIINRKRLMDKAILHPVEVGIIHRTLVAGLLFILPMFLSEFLSSLLA